MEVPILKQGPYLIASIQSALTDADLLHLRDRHGATGRDVPFSRSHRGRDRSGRDGFIRDANPRDITFMIRLRGAETVIVGIQPDVAFTMVQLGLKLEGVPTALDLEEGIAYSSIRRARSAGKEASPRGR